MARILIHTLLFTPDAVSIAYLLRDLGRELCSYGHVVDVLTTTPHYIVLPSELVRQPLRPYWGRWLRVSDVDGMRAFHVAVPRKGASIGSRIVGALCFQTLAMAWALTRRERYDVILTPSQPLTLGVAAWLMARKWGSATILNVQDVFPDNLIRSGRIRNPVQIRALRTLERFVYAHSDAVSVITPAFAQTLRPRVPAATRLVEIPNFVDIDLYHPLPRRNAFSAANGLDDRFVVSYAGNIGHGQDLEPLLVAAEQCRDLPLAVLIAGDGMRRPWLEAEIARRRLANVRLLSYQPREQMTAFNASSDIGTVLLDAHIRADGFPSKIYSVMACGRPVLVCADPESDLARVVLESGAGRFAPVGRADLFVAEVRRAYAERGSLPAEGARGRDWVAARYTRQVVGRQYHDLIQDLVAARRRPA